MQIVRVMEPTPEGDFLNDAVPMPRDRRPAPDLDSRCPACGAPLVQEKCKVVCRSAACVYRIVFNCSEF